MYQLSEISYHRIRPEPLTRKKACTVGWIGLLFLVLLLIIPHETHAAGMDRGIRPEHSEPVSRDTVMINGTPLLDGLDKARVSVLMDRTLLTIVAGDNITRYRLDVAGEEPKVVKQNHWSSKDRPEAAAIAMDMYTVVVTASGNLHMLDEQLDYMRSLAVPSWVTGAEPFQPIDVTVNDIGEIFALDREAGRIYHFNANGSFLLHIPLHSLDKPSALSYADESLFVADRSQGKVYVLTENGQELASIGLFPNLHRVRVIDRLIWVLSGSVIHLFDMNGNHAGNWRMASSTDPLQDVVAVNDQVFLLTSASLYYLGSLKQERIPRQ